MIQAAVSTVFREPASWALSPGAGSAAEHTAWKLCALAEMNEGAVPCKAGGFSSLVVFLNLDFSGAV